jgi:hypothetical protein
MCALNQARPVTLGRERVSLERSHDPLLSLSFSVDPLESARRRDFTASRIRKQSAPERSKKSSSADPLPLLPRGSGALIPIREPVKTRSRARHLHPLIRFTRDNPLGCISTLGCGISFRINTARAVGFARAIHRSKSAHPLSLSLSLSLSLFLSSGSIPAAGVI